MSHVKDWMLEEVMAIASFSDTALENVFQHIMKFDRRWVKYFKDKELSPELRHIQVQDIYICEPYCIMSHAHFLIFLS